MQDQNTCPICGETSRSHWGNTNGYDILRCQNCGLGITSPFPTPTDIKDSNADIYRIESRGSLYLRKQWYFKRRYHSQLRRIKQHVPSGRLLDIGCNIGLFLNCAKEAGFEVEGIELNKESAEFGRNHFKLQIHSTPLEEINFPEQSFDVITMYDVLEHIPDLHKALSTVKRILKPGGVLVVQSPNIESLMASLTVSNWCWLTPPDHLYHFTPQSMKRLITDHGFELLMLRTWEPAKDFSTNLAASWHEQGYIPRFIRGLLRDLRIIWLPTILFQRIWWQKQQGGLIELIATLRKPSSPKD